MRQDGEERNGHPKLIARQQFVTTGDTRGDQVAIVKGLTAGDVVVTAGQLQAAQQPACAGQQRRAMPNDPAPTPPDE